MPATDISSYQCQVERPEDFDSFWQDVLAAAQQWPLNPQLEALPLRSTPEVEVSAAHFQSLDGVRIFGWYCIPKGVRGPLPALLYVPGYISDPPLHKLWAKRGYAVLSVGPRGKIRSHKQFNPGYPGLLVHNIVDCNTYSYRGFYVDALRGVDFLLSRPEVDVRRIGVFGSSQGGGLSLVAAALRKEIRAASIGAPYLCGFMDAIELTDGYPYEEINDYLRSYPQRREAVRRTLAYFDGINFASRITCPLIVNIGLQDNVCPPETGFAVFNAIHSEQKKLYTYDRSGHDAGRKEHDDVIEAFFREQLQPRI